MAEKKKGFFAEFKEFISRGNVMDLAVGVIIGGAFQKIVTSMVNDLIMPWVGLLTGGVNFADQFVVLKQGATEGMPYLSLADATADGATVFAYGAFITAVIDFLIMALIIFLMVRSINKISAKAKAKAEAAKKAEEEAKKAEEAAKEPEPEALSKEAELLLEIRDLLKKD